MTYTARIRCRKYGVCWGAKHENWPLLRRFSSSKTSPSFADGRAAAIDASRLERQYALASQGNLQLFLSCYLETRLTFGESTRNEGFKLDNSQLSGLALSK